MVKIIMKLEVGTYRSYHSLVRNQLWKGNDDLSGRDRPDYNERYHTIECKLEPVKTF